MKLLKSLAILALCSAALYSCKKETEPAPGDTTNGYFPLQRGKWVEYDVDSTIWDDFTGDKYIRNHRMRYSCVDTFTDNAGRLSYRFVVDIRKNDTDAWRSDDVFYVTPSGNNIEVFQKNIRFIKMVTPIQEGKTWDGNALNNPLDGSLGIYKGWEYKYQNVDKSYDNGRVVFQNTVDVPQVDYTDNDPETMPTAYAERTYSRETYGKNIGLIYREYIHWIYDPSIGYRKGTGVIMRAINHN